MSLRNKQHQLSSSVSRSQSRKRVPQRPKRTFRTFIEEYILDHKSQNHSKKTIEWHILALGNLADFLEKQGMRDVAQMERMHILSWLHMLSTQPGAKGRVVLATQIIRDDEDVACRMVGFDVLKECDGVRRGA